MRCDFVYQGQRCVLETDDHGKQHVVNGVNGLVEVGMQAEQPIRPAPKLSGASSRNACRTCGAEGQYNVIQYDSPGHIDQQKSGRFCRQHVGPEPMPKAGQQFPYRIVTNMGPNQSWILD